jgi:lambda repressor-like predicted transcriptional regulator
MKHGGDILRIAIAKAGVDISKLCAELHIYRGTLYNVFKNPNPKLKYFIQIGEAIGHDFSEDWPELKKSQEPKVTKEEKHKQEENLIYMHKYYDLLEKYLALVERQAAEPGAPYLRQGEDNQNPEKQ